MSTATTTQNLRAARGGVVHAPHHADATVPRCRTGGQNTRGTRFVLVDGPVACKHCLSFAPVVETAPAPQNVKIQGGGVVHRATSGGRPYCNPNRASSDVFTTSSAVTCKRCLRAPSDTPAVAEPVRRLPGLRGHANRRTADGIVHRANVHHMIFCTGATVTTAEFTAAPVNCPMCIRVTHDGSGQAATFVRNARRLQGWQEPRGDVPAWWPPVPAGELVETTPPVSPGTDTDAARGIATFRAAVPSAVPEVLESDYGISVHQLEAWLRKWALVGPESLVYVNTPAGELVAVERVRLDAQGDLLLETRALKGAGIDAGTLAELNAAIFDQDGADR